MTLFTSSQMMRAKVAQARPSDGDDPQSEQDDDKSNGFCFRFDLTLLIGVLVFIASQTTFQLLLKKQDDVLAPKCEDCVPTKFHSPTLQAFFGNLSELVALPFFVAMELYFRRVKGLKHGSMLAWKKLESLLGFKSAKTLDNCSQCSSWEQESYAGFVFSVATGPKRKECELPQELIESPPKPRCPFYYWFLPAWTGLMGSIARNIAFTYMAASAQSMLSGLLIPVIALFSWWLLKADLKLIPHILGVVIVFAGVLCIALMNLTDTGSVAIDTNFFIGVALTVVQVILYGINNVWHEYMLTNYDCNPFEIISLDSMGSFFLIIVLLAIFQATGFEDVMGSLYQVGHDSELGMIMVAYIFVHMPAQVMQYFIIGRSSAMIYNLVAQCQSGVLWIVELAIGWNTFAVLQLIGFILIASGTLIYTYVIPVRAWMKIEPSLEKILETAEEKDRKEILDRYLEGDGNTLFRVNFCKQCFSCPSCTTKPADMYDSSYQV
mmetsp:Transcript_4563/g.6804  ORF Transcript_4563/g.6804 Transcript_4563/m.6804 type:complete len:493 (+) Transcript_4563:583-2061(+)|eukprot:CAMPEP_0203765238 /NCGR_PEP_ID=MMETSP0098-20131031/18304_1 /ASSEMBLY_ACC=CAM_ASM_000208 /TAXON_ID=96639 /ORGANISM=" , Strain NY0313808BC1" /LENGTH=492 /DNA_ID=CAMNT_0050661473 /DNA_START=2812 /DNA_END=4290 /DNA_ORIENTATION=-